MLIVVFLGIISLSSFVYSSEVNQLACYNAKTCIHNGKQKCGIEKSGEVRRFIDICDMLEFNCLQFKEYVKTSKDQCQSLPPIDPKRRNYYEIKAAPGRLAVISQYWCWRAKYCHIEENPICARDRRRKETKAFQCECTMYKHNCDQGHDFTATGDNIQSCMKHGQRRYLRQLRH